TATIDDSELSLDIIAPDDPRGVNAVVWAHIESDLPDPDPGPNTAASLLTVFRTFTVNTPDDFGAGSLRETIEQVNAGCDGVIPRKTRFDRPMRIAPRTPLPAIASCDLVVDGGVYDPQNLPRNRYFDVPRRVEIAGDEVESGSGLTVALH